MISRVGKTWWGFLLLLMTLAVWTSATGLVVLHGFPTAVLESLADGDGLLLENRPQSFDGTALLSMLPGDSVAWAAASTALTNSLALIVLYLALWQIWKNPLSPTLAVGAAFFASGSLWIEAVTPQDGLLHLLLALSLAALANGALAVLASLVLILGWLSPPHAIVMFVALAFLGYRRQAAYGLALSTATLFGVGCLLVPLAGDYRLDPGLSGWRWLSLLPLLLCLANRQIRAARAGIYTSLLLGSALTGFGELASILAVGDAAFVALQWTGQIPEGTADQLLAETCPSTAVAEQAEKSAGCPEAPGKTTHRPDPAAPCSGFRISTAKLLGLLATVAMLAIVLPGETYLNQEILLPAQRARVPLPQLFAIFSLRHHAESFSHDAWRARVPYPDLTAADCDLALDLARQSKLERGFCPLTPESEQESRRVAMVYALTSGQPLGGWEGQRHLAAPLLLCKLKAKNFLHKGPSVIFRERGEARLAPSPAAPTTPAPLDFRALVEVPYRIQTVSSKAGAAYTWVSGPQIYELSFLDRRAEVVLSSRAGDFLISSPGGAVRHLVVPELKWELSELPTEIVLPSRSLVRLNLRLTNRGEGAISSAMLSNWRVQTASESSFSLFVQKTPRDFILFTGESLLLPFEFATPEAEGLYTVKAVATTLEGEELEVPLSGTAQIRTWRRLPPVGTWVEEP